MYESTNRYCSTPRNHEASMRRAFLIAAFVCLPELAAAQSFVTTQASGVAPTMFGSVALADMDGDGDLDFLVTGSRSGALTPEVRIYRNDGRTSDGSWSVVDTGIRLPDAARYLTGARASSTDIADFDNDGDLDVLLSGPGGTVVYRNEGDGRFTAIRIRDGLNQTRDSYYVDVVTAPYAAWGDYDGDGDLDILLSDGTGSYIFRNDGFARFTQIDAGLPPLHNGIVAWGDFDNDGDLDVLAVSRPLLTGRPSTRIFRNDNGAFVDIGANLPGIEAGSVTWGDYDGDGDLDVLIMSRLGTWSSSEGPALRPGVYRNDNGFFRQTTDSFPLAWHAQWIDYDNDGDLDILLNGLEGSGTYAQLLRNDNGRFVESSRVLSGVWFGDVATGDIDGDGRVDIVMNGRWQSGSVRQNRFVIHRNTVPIERLTPPPPTALTAERDGDRVTFTWRPPLSDANARQTYTYNLRVGTTPGGSDILAPMSLPTGRRLVPERGNAGHRSTFTLNGIRQNQTYYWSVQSVDHRQVGSPFAIERIIPREETRSTAPVVSGNYPNPFNPETTIRYTLDEPSHVRVAVYNVLGAELARLVDSELSSGTHHTRWEGTDFAGRQVPSGVYFYAIETPHSRIMRSMLLVK